MAVLQFPHAFSLAEEVREFIEHLRAQDVVVDNNGCLELIEALEDLKSAAAAAQVEATAGFAASVRAARVAAGAPASTADRKITKRIAEARHESPHKAAQLVGIARCLVEEMPHTLAALARGDLNEFRATIMVRETMLLTRENRALVDQELAPQLKGMGNAAVAREAKKIGYRLEPGLAYKRAKAAEVQRHVSLRPAPDCMTILTAYLPVAEGVAVYAALTRAGDAATVDPQDERGRGQVMADTLADRILGRVAREPVPVEVQLVISDETLVGGDEPGHVNGFGPIPAPLARQLADPPDTEAQRSIRRLWAAPETGQLVQMESRGRFFPDGLRRFIIARDQYCVTPWCDAPIRQIDHIIPAAQGGPTNAANGQGLCQACNLARQG